MQPKFLERLLNLLLPSVLGGLACLVLGMFITLGIFFTTSFTGSQLNIDLLHINNGQLDTNPLIARYQLMTDAIQDKDALPNVSFFMFWSVLGLIVYYAVAGFATGFQKFNEFKEELGYVHVDNKKLIAEMTARIFVRLLALILLVIFARFFALKVLSFGIDAARIAGVTTQVTDKLSHLVASLVVIVGGLHLGVVLTRIVAFRTRLLSD